MIFALTYVILRQIKTFAGNLHNCHFSLQIQAFVVRNANFCILGSNNIQHQIYFN
jgi:hypothetical protein